MKKSKQPKKDDSDKKLLADMLTTKHGYLYYFVEARKKTI